MGAGITATAESDLRLQAAEIAVGIAPEAEASPRDRNPRDKAELARYERNTRTCRSESKDVDGSWTLRRPPADVVTPQPQTSSNSRSRPHRALVRNRS
jgi:hypothetical protein